MRDDQLADAMRAVGLRVDAETVDLAGGASGSGVHRVRVDGDDAVLKVTLAGRGQRDARRELAFYQRLADRVPVVTPTLLGYADNDEFTALLLSAHGSARPAREWDRPAWLDLARQLAALHSIPPPAEDPWIDPPAHRRIPYRPSVDLAAGYWSTTDLAGGVRRFLDEPDELARALRALPDRFLHGDCHVDNLLRAGERIVWADWQAARVGCPAGELAFLWSRADVRGAEPPYDAMVSEYAAHRDVDLATLRRALVAAEIDLALFAWPHFAAALTEEERGRLTRRLARLVDDWHASAG